MVIAEHPRLVDLISISGPPGVGKGTLVRHLADKFPGIFTDLQWEHGRIGRGGGVADWTARYLRSARDLYMRGLRPDDLGDRIPLVKLGTRFDVLARILTEAFLGLSGTTWADLWESRRYRLGDEELSFARRTVSDSYLGLNAQLPDIRLRVYVLDRPAKIPAHLRKINPDRPDREKFGPVPSRAAWLAIGQLYQDTITICPCDAGVLGIASLNETAQALLGLMESDGVIRPSL